MWWITMVWAGPADVLGDSDAAAAFDYCAWQFEAGAPDAPDVAPLLASENEVPAPELAAPALVDGGMRIAAASDSMSQCARTFRKGQAMDDRAYRKVRKRLQSGHEPSDDPAVAEIQDRIGTLWADDQAARRVYVGSRTDDTPDAALWARRLAVARAKMADFTSTRTMQAYVAEHGWLDAHRFGDPIARHAWLLVQHADRFPAFQAEVLALMEPLVDSGGVRTQDYAYLFDRVAVNHGRKQRYGTQPIWVCDEEGNLPLAPLEEPEGVDARRAEMGLGPVADALAEMSRFSCR